MSVSVWCGMCECVCVVWYVCLCLPGVVCVNLTCVSVWCGIVFVCVSLMVCACVVSESVSAVWYVCLSV